MLISISKSIAAFKKTLPTGLFIKKYSTIYALSSGHGKCGVAVIRISGDNAKQCLLKMTSARALPPPRKAVIRHIINPTSGEVLDKGLILWFPYPKSFTGEDCVELHLHGGPAVLKGVLSALGKLPDFTPAQPGDFTKRAFYNSKLDLTSVEGLGDLIHAETEAQRRQALRQMEGALRDLYSGWRQCILRCRANIEAYIDFAEDENIEHGVLIDARKEIESLVRGMSRHLRDSRRGERLKAGLRLVILGKPNVGKSSFLNSITQRPAAIVSSVPGTTRDVINVSLDIGGFPVNISDTAGLRATEDVIEKEGIRRALGQVEGADLAIVVVDASEAMDRLIKQEEGGSIDLLPLVSDFFGNEKHFSSAEYSSGTDVYSWLKNNKYLILLNKIDLLDGRDKEKLFDRLRGQENVCFTSVVTSEGVDDVLEKMVALCDDLCGVSAIEEEPYLTSQRQRTHIEECLGHLRTLVAPKPDSADVTEESESEFLGQVDLLGSEETLVLAAQRLQLASNQLGYVTGHITTEDVLDVIFSSFCIGK